MTDLTRAVEVAENTFWVSQRDPHSLLQTNTYLRRFQGNGKQINYLIDPGPSEFFPDISSKVANVIDDISNINMYSINHQDPDVGMNSTFIARMNPRSVCLCSEDTWRLTRFFEIPENTYKNVYSFPEKRMHLTTDPNHVLEIIPTPYCHFVGAFAVYDRQTRMLFTGDLFGGLNPASNMSLYATEDHWDGIRTFHEIYMPTGQAVRRVIDTIYSLDLPPLAIVPQHGSILQGDIMHDFLKRLYYLPMGLDIQKEALTTTKEIRTYNFILSKLYDVVQKRLEPAEFDIIFDTANPHQQLLEYIDITSTGVHIKKDGSRALELFLQRFSGYHDKGLFNELRSLALKETVFYRLPLPMDMLYHSAQSTPQEAKDPLEDDAFWNSLSAV
jgi:eukaryotic-like serine/threonine-protein kinase